MFGSSKTGESGAVIVEFGIVFPIMALIIAATVAFGFMFSIRNSLHHAAREGARIAAITGDGGEALEAVNSMTPVSDDPNFSIDEISTCDPLAPGVGQARVALTYTWTGFTPIAEVLGTVPLKASVVMRCGA
jgi:hypothetical protein